MELPMIGTTVAHYKILKKLGEGGMGAVYLAEDSRLDRWVALKVLPEEMASDPDRLARFEREAKAVAALNHPNIITVHSIEHEAGIRFITMELVEGKSLKRLIPRDGFDLKTFFEVAIPLAGALAVAHGKGITHRDLKPANVMVTDDDRLLKILDFGLAKLAESEGEDAETQLMTQDGMILGTVPYMSPEQAEGRKIDHRSDVFSLGIVLYQMVTGRAPFRGDSPLSVLAAIATEAPEPVEQLNSDVPRHLGRIIRKCLEKDAARRYQSTQDLHNDLVDLSREVDSGEVEPVVARTAPPTHSWWLPALLAVVGLGVLAILVWRFSDRGGPAAITSEWRTRRLTGLPGVQSEPSLSPDGRSFVFVDYAVGDLRFSEGRSDIYTQRVGGARAINLTADWDGANLQPAYSPEGQRIAFRSDREGGGLFVMGATGESPRKIVDQGFDPDWSPDGGSIVYATNPAFDPRSVAGATDMAKVNVVDLTSGAERTVTEQRVYQPTWSPSGDRIAFFQIGDQNQRDIVTVAAAGGKPVWVTDDVYLDWSPEWSPDGNYLYFASNRGGAHNIWKVPIDERTGEVLGEPMSVTRGGTALQGLLSITADGRSIAYAARQETSNIYKVAFDPETLAVSGAIDAVTSGPRSFRMFDISSDGAAIVALHDSPWADIVLMSSAGSGERKLTDDPVRDWGPQFSADGERVYFFSPRDGHSQIWSIDTDGAGLAVHTSGEGRFMWSSPSPDGTRMLTNRSDRAEVFSLTESYSEQEPDVFPLDEDGRSFVPIEWRSDGEKILGYLHRGGEQNPTWTLYDFGSKVYQPLVGADTLEDLGPLGIGDLYLGARDHSLVLYDDRREEVRELLSVAPDFPEWIEVAPDQRAIYFLRSSATSDIHLLEAIE